MRRLHPIIGAFLVVTALVTSVRAEPIARLRATWKEKDARVLAFSPDGRSLVSSGGEGVQLRDTETGKVRTSLADHSYMIHGVTFSPDGRFLFAKKSSDRFKPLRVDDLKVWRVASGLEYASLAYVSDSIYESTEQFALSRDGKRLAVLDHSQRLPVQLKTSKVVVDGRHEFEIASNINPGLPRVKIWDIDPWKETVTLEGGSHMVFSPDGLTLVTGAQQWKDPVAKVWDVKTGLLRAELSSEGGWVKPMTFSPDGKYLALGNPKTQVLYEFASGRKWPVGAEDNRTAAPVFSRNGGLLFPNGLPRFDPFVQGRRGSVCYDLTTLPPRRLELDSEELAIAPDGSRYAAVLGKRGRQSPLTVVLRDLPSLRESGRIDVKSLMGAEFSPDNRWLALLAGRDEMDPDRTRSRFVREIALLDPTTARVALTIPSPGETWGNYGWKFAPNGRFLAVSFRTGSNVSRPGEPDPSDRPRTLEIWEIVEEGR